MLSESPLLILYSYFMLFSSYLYNSFLIFHLILTTEYNNFITLISKKLQIYIIIIIIIKKIKFNLVSSVDWKAKRIQWKKLAHNSLQLLLLIIKQSLPRSIFNQSSLDKRERNSSHEYYTNKAINIHTTECNKTSTYRLFIHFF